MLNTETLKREGLTVWSGTPNLKKKKKMSCLTLIAQRVSCLARSLTGKSYGRSSRSGRYDSAAQWRCLQNTLYKVITALSQRRDVGRYYLGTASAIAEQSARIHDILYCMLLKKENYRVS
jgi:hypothetical protein